MDFGVWVCRSWRSLAIVVCTVSLIHAVIVMSDSTIHSSWDRSGWRMAYLSSFWSVASAGNLSSHKMNSNFYILRFGMGVKGVLSVDGAPKMHNILGISQVRHLYLDR